jgi:hypothetical protein
MREVPELTAVEALMLGAIDRSERCEFIPSIAEWGGRVKVWEDGAIGLIEGEETFLSLKSRGLVGSEYAPVGYSRTEAWITEEGRRALAFYEERMRMSTTMELMGNVD